ncbi:MAG: hypothetical protein HZA91_12430 [Verrucomicrobia bacterium]|nr:hypothetical protein [Verrucomicrobiota bacterium]
MIHPTFKTIITSLPLDIGGMILVVDLSKEKMIASEKELQRNVYRVDDTGNVVWRVAEYNGVPGLSRFTNVYLGSDGELRGYNFDGAEYEINIRDGLIKSSRLLK